MTRPLIGVNMDLVPSPRPRVPRSAVNKDYLDALLLAGGVPVPVALCDDLEPMTGLLRSLQGFLFIGADDYYPEHYGGRSQRQDQLTTPQRDRFDMLLGKHILFETALPALGICGGQQLFNIVSGGKLIQDIATDWIAQGHEKPLAHNAKKRKGKEVHGYRHALRVAEDSQLARLIRPETGLSVNSYHHQAVDPSALGRGWKPVAWAEDDIVEAMEPDADAEFPVADRFLLGVQWHAERHVGEPAQEALFKALVMAAQKNM